MQPNRQPARRQLRRQQPARPALAPLAPPQQISDAGHTIRIHNRGPQMVSLQVGPPGGDFFLTQSQVHLKPRQTVDLPRDHVRMDQVNNLKARGLLRVTFDSQAPSKQDA